ncbi:SLC13 family permease [Nautilia sp.]
MKLLKKEWLFFIFLSLFFFLFFNIKPKFKEIYEFIDWGTIRALSALLLITTALKLSGFFDAFAVSSVKRFKTERALAFAFVTLSAFLSMFLTNDITLFVMVPLTLAFSSQIKNDLTKLVIFEAIAVNVGSELTPFGNPQNIFLFRQMDISVIDFIREMGIVTIPSLILLIIFIFIFFPKKNLEIEINKTHKTDKFLFISSIVLFVLFIVSLEYSLVRYALLIIVLYYLFTGYKNVFLKFDYFLIFTFIIMFIDFGMLSRMETIKSIMGSVEMNFYNVFNISIILSQIISNVPAAIFISNFSNNYIAIAYGVDIAGNGLLTGSLANIIALRFLKNPKAYIDFHKYSIPYFIVSYLIVLVIFYKII